MINKETYLALRAKFNILDAWVKARNYRPYFAKEAPVQISNEERSLIEEYEFVNNPPDRYFCYISGDKATTFAGTTLGAVYFGKEYRCPAFGSYSKRVPVTIKAINGRTYYGTYYKSSGDYARIKVAKSN